MWAWVTSRQYQGNDHSATIFSARIHLKIHVPEVGKVRTDNLIGVCEYYSLEGQREQNVQEKDFVCPDDALLFRLQHHTGMSVLPHPEPMHGSTGG
jgi:hypothetical protein